MSVSFTDKDENEFAGTHIREESPVGAVYIPLHGVELSGEPGIRYEKYPWIEKFELDGIKPAAVCCIWPPAEETLQDSDMVMRVVDGKELQ